MKRFNAMHPWRGLYVCTMWILVAVWLSICLILSSQNGEESGKLNLSIAHFIVELFRLPETSILDVNRWLRTLAHVICFFVLSVFSGCACTSTFSTKKWAFAWPLLPCGLFAFWDEIRKAYIPGRHCSISEACLNTLGCVLGCALVGIVSWKLRRRKIR